MAFLEPERDPFSSGKMGAKCSQRIEDASPLKFSTSSVYSRGAGKVSTEVHKDLSFSDADSPSATKSRKKVASSPNKMKKKKGGFFGKFLFFLLIAVLIMLFTWGPARLMYELNTLGYRATVVAEDVLDEVLGEDDYFFAEGTTVSASGSSQASVFSGINRL